MSQVVYLSSSLLFLLVSLSHTCTQTPCRFSFLIPVETPIVSTEPIDKVLGNFQDLKHLLGPKTHVVIRELYPDKRSHSLAFQTLPLQRRKKIAPQTKILKQYKIQYL